MSENDGEAAGGNSPIKLVILVVVVVALVGALVYSTNKSKGLKAEGLPPAKPVDPNAPKREVKMPDLSAMGGLLKNKKADDAAPAPTDAAPAEAAPAPAEAAPAEAAPAEAAPAPAKHKKNKKKKTKK